MSHDSHRLSTAQEGLIGKLFFNAEAMQDYCSHEILLESFLNVSI